MKTNLKPTYHNLLTEVGQTVDDVIGQHLESNSYNAFPEKRQMYQKMLGYKRGTQKLRAMAAYLAFSTFSNLDCIKKDKVKRILSAVELENYSNYALNWAFDGKAETKKGKQSEEQTLAAFGFLNEALDITEDMPKISSRIRKYNHSVHRGWTPEVYTLNLENKAIFNDFRKFWKAYKIRNIEAGGQFYENYVALAGMFTKNKDKKTQKKLENIFRTFGEYVQIVNDFGDIKIPDNRWVSEKTSADQFADLKNNVVTLPIWLMYTKASDQNKKFLESLPGKQKFSKEQTQKVYSLFYEHAFEPIHKIIKKRALRLKKQIRKLPIEPKTKGLLEVMASMLSSNKKIYMLRHGYESYKPNCQNG